MDRRAFGKFLALLGCSACIPKGKPMPQLGDLFAKLALGQTLNSGEILDARTTLNTLQMATSFIGINGDIDATYAKFAQADFEFMPLQAARFIRSTSQTIATGSQDAIEFSSQTYSHGWFSWDSASPTKVLIRGGSAAKVYLMSGYVNFNGEADTGDRTVVIAAYDLNDGALGGQTVALVPAANSANTVVPFSLQWYSGDARGFYIQVEALQDSGSNVDVDYVNFSLLRAY